MALPPDQATRCKCTHALLLHGPRCKVASCKCMAFQLPASTLAERINLASLSALIGVKRSIQARYRKPIIGLKGNASMIQRQWAIDGPISGETI